MGLLSSRDVLEVFQAQLQARLEEKGADPNAVRAALGSGYYCRTFGFSGQTWVNVSDSMYGNKQFSSSFEIDAFVDYTMGAGNRFSVLPEFQAFVVKSRADVDRIAAAEQSQDESQLRISSSEILAWVRSMPETEKDSLLARIIEDDVSHPEVALRQRAFSEI
jgi:hypothetical protein